MKVYNFTKRNHEELRCLLVAQVRKPQAHTPNRLEKKMIVWKAHELSHKYITATTRCTQARRWIVQPKKYNASQKCNKVKLCRDLMQYDDRLGSLRFVGACFGRLWVKLDRILGWCIRGDFLRETIRFYSMWRKVRNKLDKIFEWNLNNFVHKPDAMVSASNFMLSAFHVAFRTLRELGTWVWCRDQLVFEMLYQRTRIISHRGFMNWDQRCIGIQDIQKVFK